jgi:PBP1b-binding outer membrane lipoprotein LpoB
MKSLSLVSAVCILLPLIGCAPTVTYVDPSEPGKIASTGIESQDIIAAAKKAATSIRQLPAVAKASRPQVILLTEVQNLSATPIDTSLYTSMLRDNMMASADGKVRFIDRSEVATNEAEQQSINSGQVSGLNGATAKDRQAATYDYLLTAELRGLSMSSAKGQSDYHRVSFKLIDRRTDELKWTDAYQVKKEGRDSAVYR